MSVAKNKLTVGTPEIIFPLYLDPSVTFSIKYFSVNNLACFATIGAV
jgi:hypothetical protein